MPAPPLIRDLAALTASEQGGFVAIGNFDGVHLGHQQVLSEARRAATKLGAPLGVLLFEPHPRRHFAPDAPPFRLTQLATRHRLLAEQGVDFVIALPFDAEMAALAAQDFIDKILLEKLQVRGVAIGHDFHFGRGREGTPQLMQSAGAAQGFAVSLTAARIAPHENAPYSSSAIRAALEAGAPQIAAALLGRDWAIEGRVCEGDKRGRAIGFPTANIALGDYLRPRFGVYLVETQWQEHRLGGVANLGTRPTVDGDAPRLEAHFFDFDGDLYGAELRVSLLDFIRAEQKFASLDALKAQIARDKQAAIRLYHSRLD